MSNLIDRYFDWDIMQSNCVSTLASGCISLLAGLIVGTICVMIFYIDPDLHANGSSWSGLLIGGLAAIAFLATAVAIRKRRTAPMDAELAALLESIRQKKSDQ